jgi:hypothetical protein
MNIIEKLESGDVSGSGSKKKKEDSIKQQVI